MEATIKALAPWFGAKRNLAAQIVAELGEHRCYWEPFCGSMAVLLAKPECTTETVCDLNGDLINLANTLRDDIEGPRLYRKLRRVMFAEATHDEAVERMKDPFEPTPDRAFWYFIFSWQGRNGVSGTRGCNVSFAKRFTSKGGQGGQRFHSAVNSIPAWRRRIRRVNVLRTNAFETIPNIDDEPGTAIYVDPPYLRKSTKYLHDLTDEDHRRLAEQLRRFAQARVVVSYYDEPELNELYPGWTKRHLEATKGICSQGQRGAGAAIAAPEVLLINGPSYVNTEGTLF